MNDDSFEQMLEKVKSAAINVTAFEPPGYDIAIYDDGTMTKVFPDGSTEEFKYVKSVVE